MKTPNPAGPLRLLALLALASPASAALTAPTLLDFSKPSHALDSAEVGGVSRPTGAWSVLEEGYVLAAKAGPSEDRLHFALAPCPQLAGARPPGFTLATSFVVQRLEVEGDGDRIIDVGLRALGDEQGRDGITARFVIDGGRVGSNAKGNLHLQGLGAGPESARLSAFRFEPGWHYSLVLDCTPRPEGLEVNFTFSDGLTAQTLRMVVRQRPEGVHCGYAARVRTSREGPRVDFATRFDKFEFTLHPAAVP